MGRQELESEDTMNPEEANARCLGAALDMLGNAKPKENKIHINRYTETERRIIAHAHCDDQQGPRDTVIKELVEACQMAQQELPRACRCDDRSCPACQALDACIAAEIDALPRGELREVLRKLGIDLKPQYKQLHDALAQAAQAEKKNHRMGSTEFDRED